jgi:hypothetical protein
LVGSFSGEFVQTLQACVQQINLLRELCEQRQMISVGKGFEVAGQFATMSERLLDSLPVSISKVDVDDRLERACHLMALTAIV